MILWSPSQRTVRCAKYPDVSQVDGLEIVKYTRTVCISNSYTMGCPPVRGDNPRALASGLSYVQVDKHGIIV